MRLRIEDTHFSTKNSLFFYYFSIEQAISEAEKGKTRKQQSSKAANGREIFSNPFPESWFEKSDATKKQSRHAKESIKDVGLVPLPKNAGARKSVPKASNWNTDNDPEIEVNQT